MIMCPESPSLYIKLLVTHLRKHGVDVNLIPWFGKQWPWTVLRLIKAIRNGHNIIHLHWMPFNMYSMMETVRKHCDKHDVKMVWTVHNLIPHNPRFGSVDRDRMAMAYMADWATHAIVHSANVGEEFIETYGDIPLNIIPHGHFIEYVKRIPRPEARRNLGLLEDKTILLMFPPNRWNKGIRTFINVLRRLPDSYMGIVAGRCTDREIIRFLKESKSELRSRLLINTNFVTQPFVHQYFGASDIFFIPYTNITTSGSAVHAISYGKPIISTRHGNMMDLVEDGVNGYLCDSQEEMIDKILSLSPDQMERLGECSYQKALTFDWDDIVTKTIGVYEKVSEI